MSVTPPGGLCSRCKKFNAYSKYTCDFCGQRLLWADAEASTMGEACPECQHPNPYANANCAKCGAQLPWWDCAAASRAAQSSEKTDQKSLATTGLIFIGVAFFVVCFVLLTGMFSR